MQTVSESRIKQWNNVKLEDGIASVELQLSKEPVLGTYTIAAVVGVSLLLVSQHMPTLQINNKLLVLDNSHSVLLVVSPGYKL